ncbi:MinD/ParA family protein [Nonomuraea sp. NPDC050556]|uniref:MinD/ParA family protein n=1 Tax=Nonomuraea sp. NPDC050556 TaxID=3364369 RepID=UPI00379ED767
MLIALCSGGHSPGATTAGLALTLAWPNEVLFAECDPAGGTLLSGYLVGHPRERGLAEWAVQLRRGADPAKSLNDQTYGNLLPGLAEPAQAASLQPLWATITETFAALPYTVIVDLGRIGGSDTPLPMLIRADQVLMVVRPTLVHLSAAAPRLQELKNLGREPQILLTGKGPYTRKEVARTLSAEVVDHLPHDSRAASVLTHGAGNDRYVPRSLLVRGAHHLAQNLLAQAVREEVMAP